MQEVDYAYAYVPVGSVKEASVGTEDASREPGDIGDGFTEEADGFATFRGDSLLGKVVFWKKLFRKRQLKKKDN